MRPLARRAAVLSAALSAIVLVSPAFAQDEEKIDEAHAKHTLKTAEKIEKQVEKLRELKYQVPVRKGMESEAGLKRHLIEETNKPENVAELAKNEKVARAFGLIPKDFNLAKEEADLLADQIAGFYDNEGKKLRLVEKKAGFMGMDRAQLDQMDELTMAHELEHALQDQTFDLGRWFSIVDGHTDRTETWKCVVEGEAVFVSMRWMFDKQAPGMPLPDLKTLFDMNKTMSEAMPEAKKMQDKMDALPAWLVKNLTMPYEDGALFVQKVYDKGGWEAVNKLFQDPPSSTQQILHPNKYWFDKRVEPAEIDMSAMAKVAGPKAKELDRSTFGEFNVRILLETLGTKAKPAKKLAAGWHGDHYQAIECEDNSVGIVWLTIWEGEDKAQAFVDAYRPGLLKLKGLGEDATSTPFSLERRGEEVLLVDVADAKLRDKLAKKAWASAVEDGHLKPLPGFFEKPSPRDFTDVDESSGFGGSAKAGTVALGERYVDEKIGFAARLPKGWTKQEKDPVAGLGDFSRGLWTGPGGGEIRVFDFPLPFDKDTLVDQLSTLATKGGAQLPEKGKQVNRTVAGHEALELDFKGLNSDAAGKLNGKLVAVEHEGVTLAWVVTAPEAKLADNLPALESVLGSFEFVPAAIKGEREVTSSLDGVRAALKLAPAFELKGPAPKPGQEDVWPPRGVQIFESKDHSTVVLGITRGGSDLEAERQKTESGRAEYLKDYKAISSKTVEREGLGKVWVSDYEMTGDDGEKHHARELVVLRDGFRIWVNCSAGADRFEKQGPRFERVLATLALSSDSSNKQADKPRKPEPKKPEPKKDDADGPF